MNCYLCHIQNVTFANINNLPYLCLEFLHRMKVLQVMKLIITIFFLLISFTIVFSQDIPTDIKKASELIEKNQFASANQFLESVIQKNGFQLELVCLQVKNAFENHFYNRKLVSFYLMDSAKEEDAKNPTDNFNISFLHYPNRLLERIIAENPDQKEAYKLMGDFYSLRLNHIDSTLINKEILSQINEKVFQNYNKAFQLGYNDPLVNRWLGNYYKTKNLFKNAKTYYQKNIDSHFNDNMTYYNLAEIYYKEKQYSQSYSFVLKALPNIPISKINVRYNALRIAALSMFYLGEIERFKKYINECIELLPDKQESYIALLEYYDNQKNADKMEELITKMLKENPFDLEGYNYLQDFVLKYNRYLFGEKLFESMMLNFENSYQVIGNIYWYRGNLVFHQGMNEEAKKLWEISRSYFSKYLPDEDPIFKKIGNINQKSYPN